MKLDYKTIKLEYPEKKILLVTLNRPAFSNAFNSEMAEEIHNLFEQLNNERSNVRVVVLTGQGSKAFSAGGDLKERNGMTNESWFKQHLIFEKMIRSVINCKVPTIGAINGAAYGGGCELASALDFVYCAKKATFAQTETKIGIIPGIGGTQNLTNAVGKRRAKEIIFSARPFSASEARDWGLVNAIFKSKILLEETLKCALAISQNAPIAIKAAKAAINKGSDMTLENGMKYELSQYNKTVTTKDRAEGVLAFNEKRKPNFKGS